MGYYIQSVPLRGKDCGIDILMDISEDNQSLILETIDGNLILVTDEMPTTFHGCYVTRKASIVRSSFCSAPSRNWSTSALRASIRRTRGQRHPVRYITGNDMLCNLKMTDINNGEVSVG